ncbi:MAG: preprotein translocase subunit YajC [Candidatus Methylomirabilota bacterium]|nr:MAG: preprotein translocase subunit YajC [candidate division NC10 bacterium]
MGIAWAQQGTAPEGGPTSILPVLLPSVLIFLVFYFLMIRPQKKKQQEQKDMLTNLKTGDQIVTTGGLYGTIVKFSGDSNRVKLKIADNVTIEIARSAITEKATGTTEAIKDKGE